MGCFLCKLFVQVKTMAWGVVIVGLQVPYQSPHSDRGYQFSLKMDKPVWIVWLFCTNRPSLQGVMFLPLSVLDLQRVCWITLWPTRENFPIVLFSNARFVNLSLLTWHSGYWVTCIYESAASSSEWTNRWCISLPSQKLIGFLHISILYTKKFRTFAMRRFCL